MTILQGNFNDGTFRLFPFAKDENLNDDEKNLHRDFERLEFILFVYTGLSETNSKRE
jgi:hypothetical protein